MNLLVFLRVFFGSGIWGEGLDWERGGQFEEPSVSRWDGDAGGEWEVLAEDFLAMPLEVPAVLNGHEVVLACGDVDEVEAAVEVGLVLPDVACAVGLIFGEQKDHDAGGGLSVLAGVAFDAGGGGGCDGGDGEVRSRGDVEDVAGERLVSGEEAGDEVLASAAVGEKVVVAGGDLLHQCLAFFRDVAGDALGGLNGDERERALPGERSAVGCVEEDFDGGEVFALGWVDACGGWVRLMRVDRLGTPGWRLVSLKT